MLSFESGPPLHLSGRVGGGKLYTCWASGRSGVSEVGERGGGGTAGRSLVVSLLIAFLEVEPQVGTFSHR